MSPLTQERLRGRDGLVRGTFRGSKRQIQWICFLRRVQDRWGAVGVVGPPTAGLSGGGIDGGHALLYSIFLGALFVRFVLRDRLAVPIAAVLWDRLVPLENVHCCGRGLYFDVRCCQHKHTTFMLRATITLMCSRKMSMGDTTITFMSSCRKKNPGSVLNIASTVFSV